MKVCVIEHVDSMHLLPGHRKCGVPHGHTYRVEVSVEGPVKDGMVIDFDILKSNLREMLKAYDHVDLNQIIPYPSCENISSELLKKLKERIPGYRMALRVWEGEGKWAECSD